MTKPKITVNKSTIILEKGKENEGQNTDIKTRRRSQPTQSKNSSANKTK
jgi:hypothetical protein